MAATQIYFFIVAISVCVKGLTLDEMVAKASEHSDIQMYNDIIPDDKASTAENLDISTLGKHREKRHALRDKNKRWTNKTIPYRISPVLERREVQIITDAMEEWANYTCVRFRPAQWTDENYVRFRESLDRIGAEAGMQGGPQYADVMPRLITKSIMVHEVGHMIGLIHHHTRPDRDDYVTINMSNINPRHRVQFEKKPQDKITTYGIPYDYHSIMHFGSTYFSINNRPTIIPKDRSFLHVIGNSQRASFRDIKMVNFMYKCNEDCPPKSCPGEGFVGKDCECWCPGNVTAGDPVIKCPDNAIDDDVCEIPGEPDYTTISCLYQYIKTLDRQLQAKVQHIAALEDRIVALENNQGRRRRPMKRPGQ